MKLRLLLFFTLLASLANSQTRTAFTEDKVKFAEELYDFIGEADKREAKDLKELFEPVWTLGAYYTDEDRKAIYSIANGLLKKRLTALPSFKILAYSLIGFSKKNEPKESFKAWCGSVEKLMANKKVSTSQLTDYLKMTLSLVESNVMFDTPGAKWKSSNSNFTFAYDSVPKIVFSSCNLVCIAKGDSAIIYNTQGTYFPLANRFDGNGGKVTWERAGFKPDEVYAVIKKYTINTKSPKYTADSVVLTYKKYFKEPISGTLEERIIADQTDERASYPKFKSYKSEFEIKNIAENIDYKGGITVSGAKLIGSATGDERARFTFFRDKKKFLQVESRSFSIKEDRYDAKIASVTFYLDKDSIFHPGLNFKYFVKDKEVALLRERDGTSFSPYFNTYHMLDMYPEAIYWKTDTPYIAMRMLKGTTEGQANFESANYYQQSRFMDIQGIDPVNPLMVVKNFMTQKNGNQRAFKAADLASFWKLDISQVRHTCMTLANRGFLLYDIEAEKGYIKDKLVDYIAARSGKTDYDVILFKSDVKNINNATLNLLNYDLRINGVDRIFLSDSQNVVIIPTAKQVVVKKNRDFTFSGVVGAGNFELYGKEYYFNYDKFKIDLTLVDSTKIRIRSNEKDEYGKYKTLRLKSQIENVKGELQVDNFTNKSGLKPYTRFPIFTSSKDSYVYYSRQYIEKGVYRKDKFYFKLDPFSIDSLDNFDPKALTLDGTLASAGILEDLREKIKVQPDYSLGFVRMTGPAGFPVYGNKGKFNDTLTLNNSGLRGAGKLTYLASVAESGDFVFYPDSMNTTARKFDMLKSVQNGAEFPDIKAQDVKIHWEPYVEGKFVVSNTTKPLLFYNSESKLSGSINIGKAGVKGQGTMDFASASLASKDFKFKKDDFKSDSASFKLTALKDNATDANEKEVAFSTNNVKADVSMVGREGKFKSNAKESFVDFPINRFICYMDEMRWYMDKDEIDLNTTIKDIDLVGAKFVSTDPDQDSLTFIAANAKFNLKDKVIQAAKVPFIDVADSRIYPGDGKVNVNRGGRLDELVNCKIDANRESKHFNIYNAKTQIYGRKKYEASGKLDYLDATGKKQPIEISSIGVSPQGESVGIGDIPEAQAFTLSSAFDYKGAVKFFAKNPSMTFTGGARMKHLCDKIPKYWVKFSGEIDPKNINIPIDTTAFSVDGDKLSAGLILVKDSIHVYPAILSKKTRPGDIDIISAFGYLTYDGAAGEYQIGSKEKLANADVTGQYITLNNATCEVFADGEMNLGVSYDRFVPRFVGSASNSLKDERTTFDLVGQLDFYLPDETFKNMIATISTYGSIPPVNANTALFKKSLNYLVKDAKEVKKTTDDITTNQLKRMPDELKKGFVFTNLNFKWNTATKSYVCTGPLGFVALNGDIVNKNIKGYIELVKKRGGDVFNMYIEADGANWYFFTYAAGEMAALSSVGAFNDAITKVEVDKRSLDTKNGEKPYRFSQATERKKREFVTKMQGLTE